MMNGVIPVVAGVITDGDCILITQRDDADGGLWEFPGGKVEAGETEPQALARELKEELGINVTVGDFLLETLHHYPAKSILLRSYMCPQYSGAITLHCHQAMAWVTPSQLSRYTFSAADLPLVTALQQQ